MSDERAIINQLERLEIGIRAAEKEIIGMDSNIKMGVINKLVDLEKEIKALESQIKIPEIKITLATSINDLLEESKISVRSGNCLLRANCRTIEDICNMTSDEIANIRNIGAKQHKEIVNLIYENGFELKRGENDGRS